MDMVVTCKRGSAKVLDVELDEYVFVTRRRERLVDAESSRLARELSNS